MVKAEILDSKIMTKKKSFGKKTKNHLRKNLAKKNMQTSKSRVSPKAIVNRTGTRTMQAKVKKIGKTQTFNNTTFGKRFKAVNKTKMMGGTAGIKSFMKTKRFYPVRTVIKKVRLHDTPPKVRPRPKAKPKPIKVNKLTGLPLNYDRTVKRIMHYVNPNTANAARKTHDQVLEEILTKAFVNLVHRTGCNCFENHNFTNELIKKVATQMIKDDNFGKFSQGHARENAALTKFHNAAKGVNYQTKYH